MFQDHHVDWLRADGGGWEDGLPFPQPHRRTQSQLMSPELYVPPRVLGLEYFCNPLVINQLWALNNVFKKQTKDTKVKGTNPAYTLSGPIKV